MPQRRATVGAGRVGQLRDEGRVVVGVGHTGARCCGRPASVCCPPHPPARKRASSAGGAPRPARIVHWRWVCPSPPRWRSSAPPPRSGATVTQRSGDSVGRGGRVGCVWPRRCLGRRRPPTRCFIRFPVCSPPPPPWRRGRGRGAAGGGDTRRGVVGGAAPAAFLFLGHSLLGRTRRRRRWVPSAGPCLAPRGPRWGGGRGEARGSARAEVGGRAPIERWIAAAPPPPRRRGAFPLSPGRPPPWPSPASPAVHCRPSAPSRLLNPPPPPFPTGSLPRPRRPGVGGGAAAPLGDAAAGHSGGEGEATLPGTTGG